MNSLAFDNSYVHLGTDFSVLTQPTSVAEPSLIILNQALAAELGLSATELTSPDGVNMFAGNYVPDGAEPLAMAYAGHQFGGFSPQLGDGRAILLGEINSKQNIRLGIQLKGAGRTCYSRGGDGRSALGPVLREYLVSEAMFKLSVPTTRALAAVTTGEQVIRDSRIPGAVLTRVATSFVRVGTFQYFSSMGNSAAVRKLADYVIERNYPQAREAGNIYINFLRAVIDRQAELIARWMHLGFIHGVMNTDNMSVAGETIDYGPCAFMDTYRHDQVYSFIDQGGRYAYGNQPSIGLWNLTRFAETLLALLADDNETAIKLAQLELAQYGRLFNQYWLGGMRKKLGISSAANSDGKNDRQLLEDLFEIMSTDQADFTLTFYQLSQLPCVTDDHDEAIRKLFTDPLKIDQWLSRWRERLKTEENDDSGRQSAMNLVNPVYIPRNHQVEKVIRAAEDHGDFSLFHDLHEVLQSPFELQSGKNAYLLPPQANEVVSQTFCGT